MVAWNSAAAFAYSNNPEKRRMPPLCSEDRRALLALARQLIVETVGHARIPDLPAPAGRLAESCGAFVTIYCRGRLRGCVGRADRSAALAEIVAQSAINAALHDSRFGAIGYSELDEMEIEISVLSELQPVSPRAIHAGTHGVLVSWGEQRAVLLPQVAAERRWSVEGFLEEACRKAGLEPDASTNPETKIMAFTVDVFSEADFARHPPGAAIARPK
jgi:AmmeMemoRadiSam system protein A